MVIRKKILIFIIYMFKSHFYTLIIIFIIYFVVCTTNKQIEGFADSQQIILMGDSVFANEKYVKSGESVFDILHDKHENVLQLAKDGSTVEDLLYQFSNMPVEYNNPSTVIFISIGGNDILEYFSKYSHMKQEKFIDRIFNEYIHIIDQLYGEWGLKARVFMCTIYFPHKSNYEKYHNMIKLWNMKLREYANEFEHSILQLDKMLNNDKYFIHVIEPSAQGSKVIADKILSFN